MSEETNQPEKKLIVDEDWKSQVEAEKEAARRTAEAAKPAEPPSSAHARPPAARRPHVSGEHALPARGHRLGLAAQPGDQQGRGTARASQTLDRHARHAPAEDGRQPDPGGERRTGGCPAPIAAGLSASGRWRNDKPALGFGKNPCPVRGRWAGASCDPKKDPSLVTCNSSRVTRPGSDVGRPTGPGMETCARDLLLSR